jgi:spermidine/putrescine transport system substrate-binding protein
MSDRKSSKRTRSPRRRRFLKLGSAASVGLLTGLSGCSESGDSSGDGSSGDSSSGDGSSGDGGNGGSTSSDRGDPEIREEYGLPELDYELEDQLNVFQWSAYWPLNENFHTIEVFEQAYGVDVSVSNFASNEEMFSQFQAGGTDQFDVSFPSDYMVNIMNNQGMLQPLDLDKIPHWENLEDRWVDEAPYDPGSDRYSAPYFWGTSGIAWNENALPEGAETPFTSWDALWNEDFAGQIRMLNDMRETMGAALKRLGYSLNSTNEDEIQEAKESLIQQKDLISTYSSTGMAEALINENASPMHSWSGEPFSAYWELYEDGSSPIGYRVPEEGSVVWVDTAVITAEAQNPNAAHAFINYVLNAQVNANIANWVYYPTPNEAAKEHVSEDMLENERIYPPDEIMQQLEFIRNLGDATQMWSEAWTEVQNA